MVVCEGGRTGGGLCRRDGVLIGSRRDQLNSRPTVIFPFGDQFLDDTAERPDFSQDVVWSLNGDPLFSS